MTGMEIVALVQVGIKAVEVLAKFWKQAELMHPKETDATGEKRARLFDSLLREINYKIEERGGRPLSDLQIGSIREVVNLLMQHEKFTGVKK